MKETLEVIIKKLVENEQEVEVVQKQEGENLVLTVKVAQEDVGRVIGKQGRIAKAIRTIIKSLAGKDKRKVIIEFLN